jgi:hypothetical protein
LKEYQRNVFLIAIHNETRGLVGTVAIDHPTELNAVLFTFNNLALIRYYSNGPSVNTGV